MLRIRGYGLVLAAMLLAVTGCDLFKLGPSIPLKPWGTTSLRVNQSATFYTTVEDASTDSVSVRFDFGDGAYSDWSNFVAVGETVSMSHSWNAPGTYYVKAQAKDVDDNRSVWSVGLAVSVSDSTQSSDSFNLQVVGHFDFDFNSDAIRIAKKDNFVLLATHMGGLYIIDVSNPQNPVEAGRYVPDSASRPYVNDVKVVGNYAYIAVTYMYKPDKEVEVLDVSNPSSPTLVGAYQDTSDNVYFEYLYVVDSLVYVVGQYYNLHIINFKNPSAPTLVGKVQIADYSHYDIFVANDYAYVACNDWGAQVVDVHDPSNPQVLSTVSPSGDVYGVFVSGNKLYTASTGGHLTIYDVQDPAHPTQLSSLGFSDNANGVLVSGNYAYVADHTAGLYVVDVSNPELPVVKGGVDTPGNAWSIVVDGNYAYVADFTSLQIVRLR